MSVLRRAFKRADAVALSVAGGRSAVHSSWAAALCCSMPVQTGDRWRVHRHNGGRSSGQRGGGGGGGGGGTRGERSAVAAPASSVRNDDGFMQEWPAQRSAVADADADGNYP